MVGRKRGEESKRGLEGRVVMVCCIRVGVLLCIYISQCIRCLLHISLRSTPLFRYAIAPSIL